MKKGIVLFAVVVVVLAGIIGCGGNSSTEEAVFQTQQLKNYSSPIFWETINGWPFLKIGNEYYRRIHMVVYRTKDGRTEVAEWDSNRPPRQINGGSPSAPPSIPPPFQ